MKIICVESGCGFNRLGEVSRFYNEDIGNYKFIKHMLPDRHFPNDINALKMFVTGQGASPQEKDEGCFWYRGFRIWLAETKVTTIQEKKSKINKLLFSICNSLDLMPDSEDFEKMSSEETVCFEKALEALHSELSQVNQLREDIKHEQLLNE